MVGDQLNRALGKMVYESIKEVQSVLEVTVT